MIDRTFTRLLVAQHIEQLQAEAQRERLARSGGQERGEPAPTVSRSAVRTSGPVWRWRLTRS